MTLWLGRRHGLPLEPHKANHGHHGRQDGHDEKHQIEAIRARKITEGVFPFFLCPLLRGVEQLHSTEIRISWQL
jgi:hypothetical protein